jgi:rhamnulose-1-phosphate aldolase/alcohol dehydrogenase
MSNTPKFQHVKYLWDDAAADKLDPVERLIYRSNILGADGRITNTGGGNTSSKIKEKDPFTAQEVDVLWVKGSGGDLRTSKKENFSSLYLDSVLSLEALYNQKPEKERGPKTPIEDHMVGMYTHCTFNLNPRPSSIDTPLHAYVPYKHVDHTHPNAVIAVAAAKNAEALTREIYGEEVIHLDWQRPGFDLGLKLRDVCVKHPQAKGVILGQHGLINWANDDKECYELSLRLIERAAQFIETNDKGNQTFGGEKYANIGEDERKAALSALLPWLRGRLADATGKRLIGTVEYSDPVMRFINSHDAYRLAGLGTSCPDHFLRTKIKPLYIEWDPKGTAEDLRDKLTAGLARYRKDYIAYYRKHRHEDSPAIRDPNPTVMLIPGLGMIAWGKDKSESRVTAEFYKCAVEVMRGSEAIDKYNALPTQEAFDIEYWLLEEAKLKRMPPEKELARKAFVIIGAGSGIGRELAHRLIKEGCHLVCVDLNKAAAEETSEAINAKIGSGIGVAGSGISGCGNTVGLSANMTDRKSIRALLDESALAYGGLDGIAVTAGIFVPSDTTGHIPDEKWALTFNINVTGLYLTADEAAKTFKEQGLPVTMVLTTSANAVVAKKGSLAYDTSKAAANHLVRELAVELAPLVRVNGVAPATVVQGSAMFPRERVIGSLAKYDIPYKESETDESLTEKLAQFYADRTLTKSPITPADQAEALYLLLSDRLSKTTGQIITVDGGLHEAFLR